ncbi:MAG: polyprenyl synthetase family protein [Caldilineaceae bacterium]|nr:polyprenyl synthetase family protein [Caldilineaceae bacterium]
MLDSNRFDAFAYRWLPQLEAEMRTLLGKEQPSLLPFYGMMNYHMGWMDENFQPGDFSAGKRIRPLLCLMACEAVGGDAQQALPAATAIEMLHNFSLVHDDIEDGDEMRRHRRTMWNVWGVPQAINAGDGMFAIAYQAILGLPERGVSAATTVAALGRFTCTCIKLTEGQYLDLSFEDRLDVTVDEYLQMIGGKTGALIAAALAIGALVGGADEEIGEALYRFGYNIGLAFQIRDDLLGIWGEPSVTGKAAGNDLLRQKKSLPVLYALNHPVVGPQLQKLWRYAISSKQLPGVMDLLANAGARDFAEEKVYKFHEEGVQALNDALGARAVASPLMALADGLVERQT